MKVFENKLLNTVTLQGKGNYNTWSFVMKNHLITAGLVKYIEKPLDTSVEKESATVSNETGLAQQAKSIIIGTLSESQLENIIHCNSAYEIWTHFEKAYSKKNIKPET